jgi:AcrR family transcriptional regulator
MEAAERALARGGVQALSLRELAREVGVSHAAPRRHFPTAGAARRVAEEGFDRLGEEMARAIGAADDDFAARLAALRARTCTSPPSTPRCSR